MSETTTMLNQDKITVVTHGGEEVIVGWTDDYHCEEIQIDRNGVLCVGDLESGKNIQAVGVVKFDHGWNKLAMTPGGGILGNVRNTGWNCYESVEEWEELCDDGQS